ncbi:hypothetical protein CEXT_371 [Caerostris extrusa]|uniref:Uncharacterized protein n=1 Tax=Caerostris extrusa TaxID=172846 RepID=A0AAV4SK59_CAEEX|nr:hypothetical protein CEXT_371 [Caerostris extrusa]
MDGCFICGGNSRPAELSCRAATAHECVVAERAAVNIPFSFSERSRSSVCSWPASKQRHKRVVSHEKKYLMANAGVLFFIAWMI